MPKADGNGDKGRRQEPEAKDRRSKRAAGRPILQLETQATVLPEPERPAGGTKEQAEAKQRGTRDQGLLGKLLGRGRDNKGTRQEHYAFAPPGRHPSPDKLRELPTSFRRTPVSRRLTVNRSFLQEAYGESWDIVYRDLLVGNSTRQGMLVFVDGLVDKESIQRFAILALTLEARSASIGELLLREENLDEIQNRVIGFGEIRLSADLAEIADRLTGGETAFFLEGEKAAILMDTRGWRDRGVQEPTTEVTVRGPRDGFNETLKTSTALLRRRLRTPMLRLERTSLGDYTRTDVVIGYIEGLANVEVVREVRRRLNRIVVDAVLESHFIEELIQDDPATFFPLVRATEYPDRVAAGLLEGKVAIMIDTTPFALLVPTTFISLMQSPEDHFDRPVVTSFIRVVRIICLLLAVFASALYVAAVNFQQEIIPLTLLERLVQAKRGVPFGTAIEILILEVAFEILREAGIRLPRPIGQAVGIVGALVLGEAAVAAGIVSSATVIVVALSAIASLALPPYFLTLGMRVLRFPLIVASATMGVFGLSIATAVLVAHLASLTSFGVPYLAPVAPFDWASWRRDVVVRAPRWAIDGRPAFYGPQHLRRSGPGQKPGPGQPNPLGEQSGAGQPPEEGPTP